MVSVDGGILLADSQAKLVDLFWGLVATWHLVCIHQINWVKSRNGLPTRQCHKHCHWY